jgi:hypothetical protein
MTDVETFKLSGSAVLSSAVFHVHAPPQVSDPGVAATHPVNDHLGELLMPVLVREMATPFKEDDRRLEMPSDSNVGRFPR